MDKKGENLITAEVTANQMYESLSLDSRLHYINQGLDLCNKFFGTDMRAIANRQNQMYNVDKNQKDSKEGDDNGIRRAEPDNV
jgi:hypothetical protein